MKVLAMKELSPPLEILAELRLHIPKVVEQTLGGVLVLTIGIY